jgi:hypothetical protein
MPTPTPEPTPAEIISLMEVTGENDYDSLSTRIATGSQVEVDAKWAKTLADIAEWGAKVRGKYAKVNGRIVLDPKDREYAIRSRVRLRYGLTERVDESVTGEFPGSRAVPVEMRW